MLGAHKHSGKRIKLSLLSLFPIPVTKVQDKVEQITLYFHDVRIEPLFFFHDLLLPPFSGDPLSAQGKSAYRTLSISKLAAESALATILPSALNFFYQLLIFPMQ